MKGTITFYSDYRGYGFAQGVDKREYFLHVSQIRSDGHRTLIKGQEISFTPAHTKKGPQATEIHIVDQIESKPQHLTLKLKKNPFTPQDPIINSEKFAGRRDSIINAVDAIYNNKNLLIAGPRGIGKSSILYQLMYLAEGNEFLLKKLDIDLGGHKFNCLSGDHRCVPGNKLDDICNGLLITLSDKIKFKLSTSGETKTKWEFDLKLFKYSSESSSEVLSATDISLSFVTSVEQMVQQAFGTQRSIVFIIDELDVLDHDIDIAPFLKATTEKFKLNNRIDVSFIVGGVTGIITELVSQHASSSRLFENISPPRMTKNEIEEIIDNALLDTGISASQESKDEIVRLSNQFPQPVHLLGYHAFRLDNDLYIDTDDVADAKTFIVSEIKRQDFEAKFQGIGSGAMTEVIRVLAQAPLETVNLNYLRGNLSHMSDERILGTLGGLNERGVIEKQHRDVYRFHDPLFKIYLRWLFGLEEI